MAKKTIITAALTGAVTPKELNPYIPLTPEEIAEDAYQCWKAGAAIVHLHMRDDEGLGTMDQKKFAETVRLIRAHKDCDVVINCTSSGAAKMPPDEGRMEHFETLPEIEMGSFDAGSINWGCQVVFENSPRFLEKLCDCYLRNDVKPELEIFDRGMLGNANYYAKKGFLKTPMYYQFVLGVLGGMEATPENLINLVQHIPEDSTWSAFGIGSGHLPIMFTTLALGGHIRVGLEDNVIMGRDENGQKILATNVKLVERAVHAVKCFGNEVATPAEAREILGIKPLVC